MAEENIIKTDYLEIPLPEGEKSGAKILKAFAVDPETGMRTGENASKQITDPFTAIIGYGQSIRPPPFDFEQLITLSESQPIHSASIEQKVTDTIAEGLQLMPYEEKGNEKEKAEILEWWESLFDEYTSIECLNAMHNDFETIGWGAFEVVRDVKGIARRIFYVPAHTLRAHRENHLFVQHRSGRVVWFKAWNTSEDYLAASGFPVSVSKNTARDKLANEVLIFRKLSRRTPWYGTPAYISCIGQIAMSVAARDFNIKFFDNYREPRHIIVITGLAEDVDRIMDDVERTIKRELTQQPHKNVILPIEGEANVNVIKLGTDINDLHFSRLMEQIDGEIMVAHRIPPDRIGAGRRGFLGGSVAQAVNTIYKDGVIAKAQAVLESRLNRFLRTEYARFKNLEEKAIRWRVDLQELDIADEQIDVGIAVQLAQSNMFTLNEIRLKLGHERLEALGDMTAQEYTNSLSAKQEKTSPSGNNGSTNGVSNSKDTESVLQNSAPYGYASKLSSEDKLRSAEMENLLADLVGGDVDLLIDELDSRK